MQKTRHYFTHDELLKRVKTQFELGIKRYQIPEIKNSQFSTITCLMSGLALFSFKFSSLLQFDRQTRSGKIKEQNLKNLFQINQVPCDTQMRERLDVITPAICRQSFTGLFARLQRNHLLDHFLFMGRYLVSLDGTGVFSSPSVHCDNCCSKQHRNGQVTYYHHVLAASLVHPDQKVVYPFAPEPIMKEDGVQKNDCERNAAKRWVADFKREHPHLKTIILADGLSSNEPFIQLLQSNNLSYILVCKEGDHAYLTDWVNNADAQDKPTFTETSKGITSTYSYMRDVPLNEAKEACRVTVVCLSETKNAKTTKWMWVTDLAVDLANIKEFTKGARARWRIENETFNTLKNQGYEFEHNFGHGNKYLHTIFTHLMILAFFVDQCLQAVNKRFQAALKKIGAKYVLWEQMRSSLYWFRLPDFETLYHILAHPPPDIEVPSVLGT